MARAKKNTVEYFPHVVNQDKFRYMLKRKYPQTGYCVYYAMLELLGGSEDHYYNMNDPYDRDYFIEYTDVDGELVDKILNDLAQWGEIDKVLFDKKVIWNQQFVDNIAGVYTKRGREIPNKSNVCDRLGLGELFPSQPVTETTQSKVDEIKTNEIKEEESIEAAHPLQLFIFKGFPIVSKLQTQLTFEDCEALVKKFPKDLIVEKLEAMDNTSGIEKAKNSVNLTLKKWCEEDLKAYLSKHRKAPKYKASPKQDDAKELQNFIDIAQKRGIKLPFLKAN